MSLPVPPAFANAELEYRQQRIRSEYAAHASRPRRTQLRTRLAALFKPRRRPDPVTRRPMPAPHHLTSRG
ncbi:MAG TPA: hypothetical protein VHC43_16170 [Mycobacteriales bacterium]|nr:hypothetical protein [Mycobacteriales bacterium]